LWDDYQRAYREALEKTSTEWAPWYIVPANQKWYRNFLVGSIVADKLKSLQLKFPEADLSAIVVK
jgi:polyphosphate kinase 2 (PPK2 family)